LRFTFRRVHAVINNESNNEFSKKLPDGVKSARSRTVGLQLLRESEAVATTGAHTATKSERHEQGETECGADYGAVEGALRSEERNDTVRAWFMGRAHEVSADCHYRNYGLSIILGTVALSYGSVPMYKMVQYASALQHRSSKSLQLDQICQTTGWGGQPIKSPSHFAGGGDIDPSTRLKPLTNHPRIRITFNGSVSDVLPWKFTPQQREVRVLPGETALAFYTATNKSADDIIGIATYSVTPAQLAPYFSKIQCFCFEEQRLRAGESVDMPVFFYLDPEMVRDLNCKGIETVTLSYTFFSEYPNPIPDDE